jgi:hypothetical protein
MSDADKGRPLRRTLAQEIDRLDAILDGLADALNHAVADAVRATVGLAVREAVRSAAMGLRVVSDCFACPQAAGAPADGRCPFTYDEATADAQGRSRPGGNLASPLAR